jgi:hypothetical protein
MKINKKLKYADFSYDEKDKTFTITEEDGNRVILNKVYSFAFMRFVIRISQRNWLRNKKIVDNIEETMLELEEENNPDQMLMFELENE